MCVCVLVEWSWKNNIEKISIKKKTNNKKALGGHRFSCLPARKVVNNAASDFTMYMYLVTQWRWSVRSTRVRWPPTNAFIRLIIKKYRFQIQHFYTYIYICWRSTMQSTRFYCRRGVSLYELRITLSNPTSFKNQISLQKNIISKFFQYKNNQWRSVISFVEQLSDWRSR